MTRHGVASPAPVDPLTSQTNALTTKILERVITHRLREIEEAVERRLAEKKVDAANR